MYLFILGERHVFEVHAHKNIIEGQEFLTDEHILAAHKLLKLAGSSHIWMIFSLDPLLVQNGGLRPLAQAAGFPPEGL